MNDRLFANSLPASLFFKMRPRAEFFDDELQFLIESKVLNNHKSSFKKQVFTVL